MTRNQTVTDVAYDFLAKRKKEVDFARLWEEVAKRMDIPEEKRKRKKSQLYSELMLDPRFAALDNNKWDLRNRRKFSEVYVDTSEIELDDDDDEELVDNSGYDLPKGEDAY